jgi:hypothetical protein
MEMELDGHISFLDLYNNICSTPDSSMVMRLSKKEHPHSPLPSLLSYHNENFDIRWHVCGVLMNFHENHSNWSRDRAENVLWSTCKVPIHIDHLRPDLPPQRYPYFDTVVGLDPESYAGGSVCYW